MRRVTAILVGLAMAMVMPATANAMKPEQFRGEGTTASASWVEEGDETFAFVDAFLNVGSFSFGGDTVEDVFFDIFIGEFSGDGFVDLFGFASPEPDEFELDAAGGSFSASVDVEVELLGQECTFGASPFPDCVPIGPFLVTVSIEWDETSGRIYPSTFAGRQHSLFGFSAFRQKSHVRFTSATGSIAGDVVMDLGTTDNASVGRDAFVDRFRFMAV